jgi:hypothetical protein
VLLTMLAFSTSSDLAGSLLTFIIVAMRVYQLVLMGLAVRAVYGLDVSKAAVAVGVPMAVFFLILVLSGW